jgi:hypothetical protein
MYGAAKKPLPGLQRQFEKISTEQELEAKGWAWA